MKLDIRPFQFIALTLIPAASLLETASGKISDLTSFSRDSLLSIMFCMLLMLNIWIFLSIKRGRTLKWFHGNFVCLLSALCTFLVATLLGLSNDVIPPDIRNPNVLAEYESELIYTCDDASHTQPMSLRDYYVAANPELDKRTKELAASYQTKKSNRGVTMIVGPAGAGKSFFIPAVKSWLPEGQVHIVRLKATKQSLLLHSNSNKRIN